MIGALIYVDGAKSAGGTSYYPDMDIWSQLDPDKHYADIYNRYAHITYTLTEDNQTSFKLLYPDSIQVDLNLNDLKKLNVKYLISSDELKLNENSSFSYHMLYPKGNSGYYIYQISFS